MPTMTYKQAAQTALDVQDACNLSGVLFSFAEVMQFLCDEAHAKNMGTRWKNEHPITYMFVSKLVDLAGYHDGEAYGKMSDAVKQLTRD